MAIPSLCEAVAQALRTDPYAFSDFYRRGRPLRRCPPPALPTLTVLVTNRCGLGCACCLARSATERPSDIALSRLTPLFEAAEGLAKAVLLGGEPFEHPEIDALLQVALRHVSREVEVYTNGLAVTQEPARFAERLAFWRRSTGDSRLVLTLAVDAYHLAAMGREVFEERLRRLLALRQAGGFALRFNVSAPAFLPERYLTRATVRAALAPLSKVLEAEFTHLPDAAAIEDAFTFNPLLRQGRFAGPDSPAQALRLTDLARGQDWVIGPDLGDPPGQERLAFFSSLNAAWAAPPPPACRLGHLEGQGAEELNVLAQRDLAARGQLPTAAVGRQNSPLLAELQLAHRTPARYWRQGAAALLPLILDSGELTLEAGALSETRATPLPLLHAVYEALLRDAPSAMRANGEAFIAARLAELGQGPLPLPPFLETPWQDGAARLPAQTPLRLPLSVVSWQTGLGDWPAARSHPLCAEVAVSQGARISWRWPGLAAAKESDPQPPLDERLAQLRFWLASWRLLLGEALWGAFSGPWRAALGTRFPQASPERETLLSGLVLGADEAPGQALFRETLADPLRLFASLGFDPRFGDVVWDDAALLNALCEASWPCCPEERLQAFRAELRSHLPPSAKGSRP